jgi:nucleotide-binding universal stress UspA family protein
VNDGTGRVPRLIVGISGSRASWWALAWAVGEARRRGARLLLVNVFRSAGPPSLADYAAGYVGPSFDPYVDHVACGNALIQAAIEQAVGSMPGDVPVEQEVVCGRIAATLASLAWGGDVLVLGCRYRGPLRRHAPGSVARACARLADCPVVMVPEPSRGELAESLPADPGHGHWFRRMPHRGARAAS